MGAWNKIGMLIAAALGTTACTWNGPPAMSWNVQPSVSATAEEEASYQLGRRLQARLEYEQAIAAYRKALDVNPAHADARNGLAIVYAAQGRYDEAIREFTAALAVAPHLAYLRNNLAYAQYLKSSAAGRQAAAQNAAGPEQSHTQALPELPAPKPERLETRAVRELARQGPSGGQGTLSLIQTAPNVYRLATDRPAVPEPQFAPVLPRVEPHAVTLANPRTSVALQADRAYRLEVSNGNGVRGLAGRVAAELKRIAQPVARLTNQRPFAQEMTEIQFRAGHAAEADALHARLHEGVRMSEKPSLPGPSDVRLVLGRDFRSATLLVVGPEPAMRQAAFAPGMLMR